MSDEKLKAIIADIRRGQRRAEFKAKLRSAWATIWPRYEVLRLRSLLSIVVARKDLVHKELAGVKRELAEALAKLEGGDAGTVKGIVGAHLQLAGYDGLCTDDCGCELADLMPCAASDGSCCDTCVPGHKVSVDPEESELGRGWQIIAGQAEGVKR